MNYTGRNVVVGIVDDGLETDHPDLKSNYVTNRFGFGNAYIFGIILGQSSKYRCQRR